MKLGVGVGSVLDEVSLMGLPSEAKGFAQRFPSGLLIVRFHVVAVGGGFFLGVSEDYFRDGSAVSFSEGAAFGRME